MDAALSRGEYFCCIVEPMQSEGGDRYATERFFRALRLLTRRTNFLVFDEVQIGSASAASSRGTRSSACSRREASRITPTR